MYIYIYIYIYRYRDIYYIYVYIYIYLLSHVKHVVQVALGVGRVLYIDQYREMKISI